MRPASVPAVETCVCGHPVSIHDEKGACTFLGVPSDEPFIGLTREMAALARSKGIPMQCACAGKPMLIDFEGHVAPLGPAVLKWPDE